MLGDKFFWNSIGNTISIFFLSAVPQLAAALLIAAVLDQNLKAKTFWRMSVLLPYVVTPVAVTLIFSSMFNEADGLANNLLNLIGVADIQWKHDVLPGHIAIATMVNWRWTGYNALILLAAMQAVPRDLHESGGDRRRRTPCAASSRSRIPSIRPTLIFVVITATIGGLQIFAEPRLFDVSNAGGIGGANRQFQTTVLYLWEMAFFRRDFGEAAAIAWLLFLLIVVFGLLNFFISRRIATDRAADLRATDPARDRREERAPVSAPFPSAPTLRAPRAPRRRRLVGGGVGGRPGFLVYGLLSAFLHRIGLPALVVVRGRQRHQRDPR